MADEQATPMPSDADLFQQATTPEPSPAQSPPASPPPEQPQQQADASKEPVRDERGRFTGEYRPQQLPERPERDQAAQGAPPQQPAPADDTMPPSHRWKEMREELEAERKARREMEFAVYDMQQRQRAAQEAQARAQPQPKPQLPDPITDPEGYYAHVQSTIDNRVRTLEQNVSFRNAHMTYGDQFEHAYGNMIAMAERGDPSIARSVMQSPDPGMAMMAWYRQAMSQARLGQHDPDTWAEKVWLEERMKDPQFRGRMLEQMRGQAAQPQAQAAPGGSPNVQLPPSLNRMAAAAPATATPGDLSDQSLFDVAFRQGRAPR